MDLLDLTIVGARALLDAKKISSIELTKQCLAQIKRYDGRIHSFLTVCEKEALLQAEEADRRLSKGETKPLLGIPFSIKDVFVTQGIRTTAGSKVLEQYLPTYSATVYELLRKQGAVLLGKTNCDAWGHGSSTENSDFGPTKNPWDPERVSGGSSGGSAAAVATGMGLFSIGEDTGGSIRQPAAFCNITGMKVTYGRVSRYGAVAFASSLDTVGPMAKTVEDCEIVMTAIAGQDVLDATTIPEKYSPGDRKTISLKGVHVGIPKEFFGEGIDREVKELVLLASKKLETLEAEVISVRIPSTPFAIAAYYLIAPSETSSNLARYDGVRFGNDRKSFGSEAKRRIMIGTYALSHGYYDQYYLKAQKVRTLLKQDFENTFEKVDVLLAPVAPTPPFRIGEKANDPLSMYLEDAYTVPINLAGVPSLALPCGFSKNGLPVGMQIIGKQKSEATLFSIGAIYQKETGWHNEHPQL